MFEWALSKQHAGREGAAVAGIGDNTCSLLIMISDSDSIAEVDADVDDGAGIGRVRSERLRHFGQLRLTMILLQISVGFTNSSVLVLFPFSPRC